MTGKQKIAFLCHPYHRGGVTRWMADAALAYDKIGWEVYFVTVDPVSEFYSAKGRETLIQLLSKEPNTVNIIAAQVGYDFEFGTPAYRTYVYRRLLIKLPPGTQVILSDDQVVWDSATYLNGTYPVIGVLHADEAHYYKLAAQYSKSVCALVCVSQRVQRIAKENLPQFDAAKIYTIPCGIELPPVTAQKRRGEVLQLVYVGRVSNYQKRATDLVKICAALKEKNISFHLNIIGDGDAKPVIENTAKEQGLEQHITCLGWRSQQEVARYLSQSDILLLTSDFEGTPIAMMEALAAGCAVVGTRVSGIEDYAAHALAKDCFAVYEVGAIDEAVGKIEQIAAIPAAIRAAAARQLGESEFSMQVCLQRYNRVITSIKVAVSPAPHIRIALPALLRSRAIAFVRNLKVSLSKR